MKKNILIILMMLLTLVFQCGFGKALEPTEDFANVRFMPVDIMIDAGDKPIAAYQFELRVTSGSAKLSGVEGGDCEAFKAPGFYDPKALNKGRIKLASFNLAKASPAGKFRCARLHFMVTGDQVPEFEITPVVIADAKGKKVSAQLTYELIENK